MSHFYSNVFADCVKIPLFQQHSRSKFLFSMSTNLLAICEDDLLRHVCLPVFSLLAVSCGLTICKLVYNQKTRKTKKCEESFEDFCESPTEIDENFNEIHLASNEKTINNVSAISTASDIFDMKLPPPTTLELPQPLSAILKRPVLQKVPEIIITNCQANSCTSTKSYLKTVVDEVYKRALLELQLIPSGTQFAAFVISHAVTREFEIISLATDCSTNVGPRGHHCHVRSLPRFAVRDTRALVVARRCLLHFLYSELYKISANRKAGKCDRLETVCC